MKFINIRTLYIIYNIFILQIYILNDYLSYVYFNFYAKKQLSFMQLYIIFVIIAHKHDFVKNDKLERYLYIIYFIYISYLQEIQIQIKKKKKITKKI